MKPTRLLLCASVCLVAALASLSVSAQDDREHPLTKPLRYAVQCRKLVVDLGDYEADFTKREVVGRRMVEERMRVKMRSRPFSVYMHFEQPNAGQEVIYVEGQNGGKLIAHLTGIKKVMGTLRLDPNHPTVMATNRYPITQMGLEKLLGKLIEQWTTESKYGEVDVKYYPKARLGDLNCKVIESSHPQPRRQFPFQKTRLYIDAATNLPVRVEQFAFPADPGGKAPLIEQYTYTNLRSGLRLTDVDFDENNSKYNY